MKWIKMWPIDDNQNQASGQLTDYICYTGLESRHYNVLFLIELSDIHEKMSAVKFVKAGEIQ